MARNPKQDANLRPIQKGELSSEEAKKRGSAGSKKSGEVRRMCRDVKKTIQYILGLNAVDNTEKNLKRLGIPEEACTNMTATWVKCYTEWLRTGNIKLLEVLMKYGRFDEAELRKARCSLSCLMTGGVLWELLLFQKTRPMHLWLTSNQDKRKLK